MNAYIYLQKRSFEITAGLTELWLDVFRRRRLNRRWLRVTT